MAPYERLQTYARRRNQQADYLHYREACRVFDSAMQAPFRDAPFWTDETRKSIADWHGSKIARVTRDPSTWMTEAGFRPHQKEFWDVNLRVMETKAIWKWLRDALSHWNVATADRAYHSFDEGGVMERLVFYRADRDDGPWDVVSVSPEVFLSFLEAWAQFLNQGLGREVLAGSEAA